MTKIKILDSQEIQKIAAGEVVERPVNVLKELIENSIDAQANQITIYLEDAGKKLIKIIDNGVGMSPEDAKICFAHHATSKITTVSDLNSITTFGFRGEALSSISSVSKILLTTKQENDQLGITLILNQGKIEKENVSSCNTGTEITIEDLFFNVPARKKFLKSRETEYRAIVGLFHAFCFSYTNISFKLYHENKIIYNCPSTNDLINRFGQLYNSEIIRNIIPIDFIDKNKNSGYKITGAISTPKYSRYDRNQIFLFVNKRWVKNYKLVQAFIKGYQGMLEVARFPSGVINIFVNPEEVDINIHPKKEEVQFLHPRLIENLITSEIKKALESTFNKNLGKQDINYKELDQKEKPKWSFSNLGNAEHIKYNNTEDNINSKIKIINPEDISNILDKTFEANSDIKIVQDEKKDQIETRFIAPENVNIKKQEPNVVDKQNNIIYVDSKALECYKEEVLDYRLIGQIFKTYIIIENDQGLTLIDQHAAHERIIYEQIKDSLSNIAKIRLLFPEIIELNSNDISILVQYFDLFDQTGISIEQISINSLVVKEVPIFLKNILVKDIILQSIAYINENHKIGSDKLRNILLEKMHAQISCKSAIKAGDSLQPDAMNNLIKNLYKIENKLTCPHGRPTIHNLTLVEIEKFFKRNYRQKVDYSI